MSRISVIELVTPQRAHPNFAGGRFMPENPILASGDGACISSRASSRKIRHNDDETRPASRSAARIYDETATAEMHQALIDLQGSASDILQHVDRSDEREWGFEGEPHGDFREAVEDLELALSRKANPNAPIEGETPLIYAITEIRRKDVIDKLLAAGADVKLPGTDGNTALHRAAEMQDGVLIMALLAHGADVNATNAAGEFPLDLYIYNTARIAATPDDGTGILFEDAIAAMLQHD